MAFWNSWFKNVRGEEEESEPTNDKNPNMKIFSGVDDDIARIID